MVARAVVGGKVVEDSCEWIYKPGAPEEVDVAKDKVMEEMLKKAPPALQGGRRKAISADVMGAT